MGGGHSSEPPGWMREDAARREAYARAQIEEEKQAAAKIAREKDELYEKLRQQNETSNKIVKETIEQKDQQIKELMDEHQRALSVKDTEIKDAFERNLELIQSSNTKIIEMEQNFRERKKVDDDKWNEKLTTELKTATDKIIMIKKEDEEKMERKLAETYNIFQDEKESLKQTINEKDQAVKQTYEKLVETQKSGIAMTAEMRKQMEIEKQKEIEKVEGKLKVKEDEIKQANDKILEVHEKGVKMANEVRIQKEREQKEIVEKMEVRHKEDNLNIKEFYKQVLEGEKERTLRLEQIIQDQHAEGRKYHEQALKIKDEVNIELKKRCDLQLDCQKKITDMYERLIENSKETALKENLGHSMQMMALISGFQNRQLNLQYHGALMNNLQSYTNDLLTQIKQSNLKSEVDTPVQENQLPVMKPEQDTPQSQNEGWRNEAEARDVAAPKVSHCTQSATQPSCSSTSISDEVSHSEQTARARKAEKKLSAAIAAESLIKAKSYLKDEIDLFLSSQTEDIEKLKKVCLEMGLEGEGHEITVQGSQFWEDVIKMFQEHSGACQNLIQSCMQDLEDLLTENLAEHLAKNPLQETGVETKIQELRNKSQDAVSCFITVQQYDLTNIFGKHKCAIDEMNKDFETCLPLYKKGSVEKIADESTDLNEISTIYFKSLEEEIKRCQRSVSGALEGNWEKLAKEISLKINS